MKISVVYQYYQSHTEPGHSLIYEITAGLANNGHDVTVIAGEFGYMKRQTTPRRPWYKRLLRREKDKNIKIVRTYTYPEIHRTYLKRLLSFISFTITCPFGLFVAGKPDVVLASSPPIFPMMSAWLFCKLRRVPLVLEVRDLWPTAAVQMGILHNRLLITIMSWMEKFLYTQSYKIVVLTEGIREDICQRGWPREKVALVTCGIDPAFLYPDRQEGRQIRQQYLWENKKVVLYFGALGEANNIPVILRAAERLKLKSEILFVLVGDGMMREAIINKKNAGNLDNVLILPSVPKSMACAYINAADICLVTLRNIPVFGMSAIPTKLIDYMACGRPILYGINGESGKIVEMADCGIAFEPDNDAQLAKLILNLTADPETAEKMGANGPAYVKQHFLLSTMQARMEDILKEAAFGPENPPPSSPHLENAA